MKTKNIKTKANARKVLECYDGYLPNVTVKHSSVADWQRILMDAHAELTRQLCSYMDDGNARLVNWKLAQIEAIFEALRLKGPICSFSYLHSG